MRHDEAAKTFHQPASQEETTMKRITVGLDLAKSVFHVVGIDACGQHLLRKCLRRAQVSAWFAQQPPCRIGMEACSSAHYWARTLKALGHEVKLVAPQHVKAFARGQKNDFNDAAAIAEAVNHASMHFVPVKSAAQLDLQALQRLRSRLIRERTGLSNQLRGLLAEHGIVLPRSLRVLRQRLPDVLEDADNELSALLRRLLHLAWQHFLQVEDRVAELNRELNGAVRQDEGCQLLLTIPGFGPVVASGFSVAVGDGRDFRRGRDVAAALGLVPRQHSTGGQPKLLGISKRGNGVLRSHLIQGARSVLMQAEGKSDPLCRWALKIRAERGFNKATVALANKLARIGWAVLRQQTTYQAEHRLPTA
ncbi:MAG: IS110 family transposase [Burkholderiales bacterium]